jgi:hypothetical protein
MALLDISHNGFTGYFVHDAVCSKLSETACAENKIRGNIDERRRLHAAESVTLSGLKMGSENIPTTLIGHDLIQERLKSCVHRGQECLGVGLIQSVDSPHLLLFRNTSFCKICSQPGNHEFCSALEIERKLCGEKQLNIPCAYRANNSTMADISVQSTVSLRRLNLSEICATRTRILE